MIAPDNNSYYLAKAQVRAYSQGGECLANKCASANDKLTWRCRHDHEWQEQLGKVLRGSWCPVCQNHHAANSPLNKPGL